jgi:hypothetical protein
MRSHFRLLPVVAGLLAGSLSGQQSKPAAVSAKLSLAPGSITSTEATAAAEEVLELERKIGAAIVAGDVTFYDRVTADDFVMTHSDKWTTGGKPLLVDDKASFRKRIENRSYLTYDLDSVRVEMHGDVAITYGRYVASMKNTPPERVWFSVWFEKAYAKRNGQWQYLSHRTVNGANYGPDRKSVQDK